MCVCVCVTCVNCRVSAKDASFDLRLHLIYLINDILHHWFVVNTCHLYCYLYHTSGTVIQSVFFVTIY